MSTESDSESTIFSEAINANPEIETTLSQVNQTDEHTPIPSPATGESLNITKQSAKDKRLLLVYVGIIVIGIFSIFMIWQFYFTYNRVSTVVEEQNRQAVELSTSSVAIHNKINTAISGVNDLKTLLDSQSNKLIEIKEFMTKSRTQEAALKSETARHEVQLTLLNKYVTTQQETLSKIQTQIPSLRSSLNHISTSLSDKRAVPLPLVAPPHASREKIIHSLEDNQLASIDLYGDLRIAVFLDSKFRFKKRVIGEHVNDWRLSVIDREEGYVKLTKKDQTVKLMMLVTK
ncbi:hypothetical protein [uncultured Shewanella sp.]|uniref:hypothetical protein n=1 Tax=uncultured Shewanella sp. TaxID=173975 RepID=UPI00260D0662|nr:hypothetical protein [uncultured Shewanella sp.]